MSSLIEIYQNSINKNISSLQHKYAQCEITSSEQRMSIITDIEKMLKETESIVKNFTIESTMQSNKNLSVQATEYKETLNTFKSKMKKMQEIELQPCVNNPMGNSTSEKLLNGNDTLAYSSFEKLQKATRDTREIESFSSGVLGDLDIQTNQMKIVTNKVGTMNDQLTSSSSLLGNMLNYQTRNKGVIVLFAVALFLTFAIICFCKWYFKKAN